jgi:hypothetical protein
MNSRVTSVLLAAFAVSFLLTGQAHAYLDPGTGSIILQGFIGAVVGGLFVVKTQWARLKAWFGPKQQDAAGDEAAE